MDAAGPSLPPYTYSPIDPTTEIRILVLEPAAQLSDPLEATLLTSKLFDPDNFPWVPPYDAVSYRWGPQDASGHIRCDGKMMKLSGTVDVMLRHLRKTGRCHRLFVDAICIDQANEQEKSEQVRCMGVIFGSAWKVRVWLGEATKKDRIPEVFAYLKAVMSTNSIARTIADGSDIELSGTGTPREDSECSDAEDTALSGESDEDIEEQAVASSAGVGNWSVSAGEDNTGDADGTSTGGSKVDVGAGETAEEIACAEGAGCDEVAEETVSRPLHEQTRSSWPTFQQEGEDQTRTCLAKSGVRHISASRDRHFGNHLLSALIRLCSREWFRRRWILQEVAFAHDLRVHCGKYKISGELLLRSIDYLIEGRPGDLYFPLEGLVPLHRLRYQEYNLLDMLDYCHLHECTEPNDRLFALFGFGVDRLSPLLPVDYSKSWVENYTLLAEVYVKRGQILDIISHVGFFGSLWEQGPSWPSWVPAWNRPQKPDAWSSGLGTSPRNLGYGCDTYRFSNHIGLCVNGKFSPWPILLGPATDESMESNHPHLHKAMEAGYDLDNLSGSYFKGRLKEQRNTPGAENYDCCDPVSQDCFWNSIFDPDRGFSSEHIVRVHAAFNLECVIEQDDCLFFCTAESIYDPFGCVLRPVENVIRPKINEGQEIEVFHLVGFCRLWYGLYLDVREFDGPKREGGLDRTGRQPEAVIII